MAARVLAAAALACAGAGASAPPGYAPLETSSTVCSRSQAINVIPKLPRYNLLAQPVSSDLGSYHLFDCTGVNTSRACTFYTGFVDALLEGARNPADVARVLQSDAVAGSLVDYGQSVAWYSILNVVLAILIPVFTALWLVGRYCCCCCGPSRCSALRCGTPWPTRKRPCCGYTDLPDGSVGYPPLERACTFLLMVVFIGLAVALLVSGTIYGNFGLTAGMHDLLGEGDGVMRAVQAAIPPLTSFVIDLSDTAVAPAIVALNATLTAGVDIPGTVGALACVNHTLYGLPNVTAALIFLTALQSGATQVSTDATTISTDLSAALLPQLDAVGQAAGALQTDVSALATAFAGLGGALDSTAGVLTATSDAYGDLLRPTTSGGHPQGLVVGAMADLATVPRVASGGGFPDTATLAAASGAPGDLTTPGTQNRMVSRAVIGNPAEMLALVGRLQAVYASLAPPTATVANYTATGAALRAVAARVASAQADLVPAVRGNVSALEAALAALPSGAAVTAHLLALNASVYAVDLSTIRGAVVSITAAVAALPSFDTLLAELRTVQALPDVLPCVRTLTDQLAGINATLARLPDSLGGLTGLYDSLNASIVSAVAAVGGAEAQLVAANASLAGFAASNNYTAQIDDLLATLQQKRAEVDLPSLLAHVGDLDAGVGGLNFTAIGVTVDALDTALGSVSPAAVTTAAGVLEAWGAFTANLTAQLERAAAPTRAGLNPAGDYALAARAYCSGNSQFFCDADADCVVAGTDHGPCFTAAAGSARCSAGAQSVPCNVDADCSGGAYCLVDLDRAVGLAWVLGAAQDPSLPPDMAAVAGSLSAMASTATGLDPGAPLVDIATAQGAVAGIDTTSASAALAGVVAALGAIDLSGINATLASVKDEIAQVPFASVSSQITSIQGTVDDLVNSKRPLVQDALMAARALRGLLFDEMPVYLARMSRANLTAALAARGPGGMLEGLVAGVADDAVAYVKRSQSLVDVNVPALAPTVDDYTPYIDKAAAAPGPYADADDHGAAYYFALLAFPDRVVPAGDATAKYLFTDANGDAYPGGRVCVTRECAGASLTALNAGGVSTWSAVLPGASFLPGGIPLSREHVFLLLWLPAAIAILLSIWAIFPCCCRSSAWKKVPASCAAGCMICQLPCLFLITAVAWPLVMVLGDVCASGPNIGVSLIQGYGDSLCPLAQGSGSAAACGYDVRLPLGDDLRVGATVDFPGSYRSLMTRCAANDPLTAALGGVADAVEPLPYRLAATYLDPASAFFSSLPVQPRPGVVDVLFNASNTTGRLLGTLVRREAAEALSCSRANGIIADAKATVCCDVLPPLFWYVSAWYLMAWAMCCCGLPAACLGRKRFPKEPWGPAYDETLAMPAGLAGGRRGGAKVAAGGVDAYDASGEVDGGAFVPTADASSASAAGVGYSGEIELTGAGVHGGAGGGGRRSGGGRRRGAGADEYDDHDFGDDAPHKAGGDANPFGGAGAADGLDDDAPSQRGGRRSGWSFGASTRRSGAGAVPVRLSAAPTAI